MSRRRLLALSCTLGLGLAVPGLAAADPLPALPPVPPVEVAAPPVVVATPASPVAKGCTDVALVPARDNGARVQAATLCLLNHERHVHHLAKLRADRSLGSAARHFAQRMVRDRFFDHTAPDGSTMVDRVKHTSYLSGPVRGWSLGENIAWGTGRLASPAEIVDMWMHSPGHRQNILTPAFRHIGLGVALGNPQGGGGATYVTDFGQRTR